MEVERHKGSNTFPTAGEPSWLQRDDIMVSCWYAHLWKLPAGEACRALFCWSLAATRIRDVIYLRDGWRARSPWRTGPSSPTRRWKKGCVLLKYVLILFPLSLRSRKVSCLFDVPLRLRLPLEGHYRSCIHRPSPTLGLLRHCVRSQAADNARAPGATGVPAYLWRWAYRSSPEAGTMADTCSFTAPCQNIV